MSYAALCTFTAESRALSCVLVLHLLSGRGSNTGREWREVRSLQLFTGIDFFSTFGINLYTVQQRASRVCELL